MKWELEKEIKLPTAALGLSTLPHSESLLVSCFDGSILRVDPRESTWETLGHHQSYASGVVSVLDGSMAVSAGYDGVLQWHHLGSGKTVAVEKIHDFWSWQLKASPNGAWLPRSLDNTCAEVNATNLPRKKNLRSRFSMRRPKAW